MKPAQKKKKKQLSSGAHAAKCKLIMFAAKVGNDCGAHVESL